MTYLIANSDTDGKDIAADSVDRMSGPLLEQE
jgi:hypothetical protein